MVTADLNPRMIDGRFCDWGPNLLIGDGVGDGICDGIGRDVGDGICRDARFCVSTAHTALG